MLRPGIPASFEEESKERCPECSQPLTFVRTKSHERRWYCYSCEKYIDSFAEAASPKEVSARLESLSGLQVIDSHGVILGRVRKAIPNERGDIKALVMSVDKEQFKAILDERELPRDVELGRNKIGAVGDVVILSDVFSPRELSPPKPQAVESVGSRACGQCGEPILTGARHCIRCGASVELGNCPGCGTVNPLEARFCKNCGARMPGVQEGPSRP